MNKKNLKLISISLLSGLLALSSCDNTRNFSSITDSSSNDNVLAEDFNKLLAPTNVIFDGDSKVLSWNTVSGITKYDIHVNGKIVKTVIVETKDIVVEQEKPENNQSTSEETSESTSGETSESTSEETSESTTQEIIQVIPESYSYSLDGLVDFDSADIFLISVRAKGENQNSKYATYMYDKNSNTTSKGIFLYSDETKEVLIGVNPHSAVPLEAELEIPEGVKEISANAFYKKTTITSVKLPSTLEKIGEGAFANTRFSRIDLSECENLVEIGDYAFEKNTNLAKAKDDKIILPSSVKRIGTKAFNETNVVMEVLEDSKLEYVGDYALYGSKIKSFFLPDSVTYVGEYAFADTDLDTIKYSEDLFKDEIPNGLFYKTKLKEFKIPSTVKRIGDSAFDNCSSLKTVGSFSTEVSEYTIFIPASVESIGKNAFKSVKIPTSLVFEENSNLKVIEESAFESLEKITSVTLPDSLERIEKSAFNKCKLLSEINFTENSNISYISSGAINGTAYLTEHSSEVIVLGKVLYQVNKELLAVETIDLSDVDTYGVIYGISDKVFFKGSFKNLVLPNTLKVIGSSSFENCTKLTSVTFSAALNEIGESAFSGCADIETIEFDLGCQLSEIKDKTFYNCESVTSIVLPNSVKYIGASAFYQNKKLETFVMSNSIEEIGDSAFESCAKLQEISFASSLVNLGKNAFKNNTSLHTVNFDSNCFINALEENKVIREETFLGCKALTSIAIPDYVISIGKDAFKNTSSLETVTLGENTSDIHSDAFLNCGISNNFDSGMVMIDDLLLKYTGTEKNVVIPGNVKIISNNAFENSEVESIVISSNVEFIDEKAFLNCTKLKTVSFGEGSNLETIGNNAFEGCSSLISISLPSTLNEIGEYAFYKCINLGSIDLSNVNISSIPAHCFDACNSLNNVSFNSSITSIGEYAFYKTSFSTLSLPSSIEVIGEYAFGYVGNAKNKLLDPENWEIVPTLKSLDLSNSNIKEIGEYAFANNIMTSVSLPDHELVLKDYCFVNSTNLTEFSFSEKWTIQQGVLKGSNNIAKLTMATDESVFNIFGGYITFIPSTLKEIVLIGDATEIATGAFAGLGNLQKVTIPSCVTKINDNAFYGCRNIETLAIDNVEYIGTGAFLGCYKLNLNVSDDVTYIGEKAFTGTKYLQSFDKDSDGEIDDVVIINGILILYNGNESNVVLDDSVKIIAGGAFAGNQDITSLTVGSGLEKICFGAFDSCTNLTSITLKSNSLVELDLGTLDTLSSSLKLKVNKTLVKSYESDIYWSLYLDEQHIEGN